MAYKEFTPCNELKEYIECFWTQTPSKFDANHRPTIEKILPDGCIDFLFRLDKPPAKSTSTSAMIIGTMTTSIDVSRGKTKIVAVRFRPGGSFPFLQSPASFFTDQAIDLASIFGDSINQLIDQIFNADTLPQAVKILEKELLSRLRSSKKLDSNFIRLLNVAVNGFREATVDDLVQSYGKSARQLERLFLANVGIGPKMYFRIKRFQAVDRILRLNSECIEWADIAVKYGYFDQSHLIRDCKIITKLTPENYRKFLKMSDFSNPISSNDNIRLEIGGTHAI
ncbi:MAG: DUF6597 domain-containing transcriptional factor [Bdellovibrio sp.]